jgi:signal transduction histidine kinase
MALAAVGLVGLRQLAGFRRRREQRRLLVEREEAKSALLRLAAHELRTPLALARGYVEMVRLETLGAVPEAARKALTIVDDKLGEIDELATHLVEAARMQDGRSQLRLELVDARTILHEAADRMRAVVDRRHPLVLADPGRPVAVVADRLRLRTVLVNLISNAIKYSPEGGEVRCVVESEGGWASVRVTDRGIGIDPERMRELFQPFRRLHGEAAPGVAGLGLGLFLSQEIARAHHGELSARPNEGRGTTFELRLPAATIRAPAGERRPAPAGPQRTLTSARA